MPSPSSTTRRTPPPLAPNPGGRAKHHDLPAHLQGQHTQPRDKKGEALINAAYVKAQLVSEQTQQLLLRPGKKDWNLIRNQVWCFGVLADKVLNTLENSEELRIKLPTQLQEGVKVMVQLQIERAATQKPLDIRPIETVCETVEYDGRQVSVMELSEKANETVVSDNPEQLT